MARLGHSPRDSRNKEGQAGHSTIHTVLCIIVRKRSDTQKPPQKASWRCTRGSHVTVRNSIGPQKVHRKSCGSFCGQLVIIDRNRIRHQKPPQKASWRCTRESHVTVRNRIGLQKVHRKSCRSFCGQLVIIDRNRMRPQKPLQKAPDMSVAVLGSQDKV